MSKVISFRLSPDNPREAEALSILHDWISQGFSTRHTITEAILMLGSGKLQPPDNDTIINLSHHIQELLARVEKGSTHKIGNEDALLKQELSDGFVASIILTAKPGLTDDT